MPSFLITRVQPTLSPNHHVCRISVRDNGNSIKNVTDLVSPPTLIISEEKHRMLSSKLPIKHVQSSDEVDTQKNIVNYSYKNKKRLTKMTSRVEAFYMQRSIECIGDDLKIQRHVMQLKTRFVREYHRPLNENLLNEICHQREEIHQQKKNGGMAANLFVSKAYWRLAKQFGEEMSHLKEEDAVYAFNKIQRNWALSSLLRVPIELLRLPLQPGLVFMNGGANLASRAGLVSSRFLGIKVVQLRTESMINTWVDLLGKGRAEPAPIFDSSHMTHIHEDAVRVKILLRLYDQAQVFCQQRNLAFLDEIFSPLLSDQHQHHREAVAATQLQWIRAGSTASIDLAKQGLDAAVYATESGVLGMTTALLQVAVPPLEEWVAQRFIHHLNTKYLSAEAFHDLPYLRALYPLPGQLRVAYIEHAAKTELVELNWHIKAIERELNQIDNALSQPTVEHFRLQRLIDCKQNELDERYTWMKVIEQHCNKGQRVELAFLERIMNALKNLSDSSRYHELLNIWENRHQSLQQQLNIPVVNHSNLNQILRECFSDGVAKVQGMQRSIKVLTEQLDLWKQNMAILPRVSEALADEYLNEKEKIKYKKKTTSLCHELNIAIKKREILERDILAFRKMDWLNISTQSIIGKMLSSKIQLAWQAARAQAKQHHVSATAQYAEEQRSHLMELERYVIEQYGQKTTLNLHPYQKEHQEKDSFLRRNFEGTFSRLKRRVQGLDIVRSGYQDRRIKQLIKQHD